MRLGELVGKDRKEEAPVFIPLWMGLRGQVLTGREPRNDRENVRDGGEVVGDDGDAMGDDDG